MLSPRRHRTAFAAVSTVLLGTSLMLTGCATGPGRHRTTALVQPATSNGTASAAPTSGTDTGSGPGRPGTGGASAWLVTRAALAQLLAEPTVGALLDRAHLYEILRPGQQLLAGVSATGVAAFPDSGQLADAVTGGTLPPGTGAVLYDPEAWSLTPASQQQDPARAAAQAAAVAHAHGLRLIVAPALNLTTVLDPAGAGPRWQRYLRLRLAATVGARADVVEVQAQSLERDTGSYADFVNAAAAQVRAVNPHATVLAGLSTNPPGAPVTGAQLAAAVQATRSDVDGYWLNVPGRGPRCPTCNAPRPEVGQQLLQQLHALTGAG